MYHCKSFIDLGRQGTADTFRDQSHLALADIVTNSNSNHTSQHNNMHMQQIAFLVHKQ